MEDMAAKRFEKVRIYMICSSWIYATVAIIIALLNVYQSGLKLNDPVAFKFIVLVITYYAPICTTIYLFLVKKENYLVVHTPNGEAIAKVRDYVTSIIFTLVCIVPIIFMFSDIADYLIMSFQVVVQTFLAPSFSFYFGAEKNKS